MVAGEAQPEAVKEQSSAVLRAVAKGLWPFLRHCEDGRWYLNKAKRRSRAAEVKDLGEAKW
jgi:hypothetical protein